MKQKNLVRILLSVCVMLVLMSGVVFAETNASENMLIPEEEMKIADLHLGITLEEVEKDYGAPTTMREGIGEYGPFKLYIYRNAAGKEDLAVSAGISKQTNFAKTIMVRRPGLATPKGFAVGTEFAKIQEAYGPGSVIELNNKRYVNIYGSVTTQHTYQGKKAMTYFIVIEGADGLIKEMRLYLED
jgi:hypothetical protein